MVELSEKELEILVTRDAFKRIDGKNASEANNVKAYEEFSTLERQTEYAVAAGKARALESLISSLKTAADACIKEEVQ